MDRLSPSAVGGLLALRIDVRTATQGARACRWLAVACLCACAAACLPRGDAPAGRQVISDKVSLLADVLPASPDGTLRLLVARIRPGETYLADIYLVSAPADGSAPTERLLVENASWWGMGCRAGPCFQSDARGRLFISTDIDFMQGNSKLVRVDPATGDRLDLGRQANPSLSPSGRRLVTTTWDPVTGMSSVTLYEFDDSVVSVADTTFAAFAGEDLFYVTKDLSLMRVQPNSAAELVRAGVNSFDAAKTDAGQRMLLYLYPATDNPAMPQMSIIDPVTLEEILPPFDAGNVSPSPDGRWLAVYRFSLDSSTEEFSLLDVATGAEEHIPVPPDEGGRFEWRPGHTELWIQFQPYSQVGPDRSRMHHVLIKKPGQPPLDVPIELSGFSGFGDSGVGPSGSQSSFTPDGKYWFSIGPSQTKYGFTASVGNADDPTAPTVKLNPDGTATDGYRPLADGRLLIEAYRTVQGRSDIYAVDPADGTSRLLGELGMVLAVGDRRVLAIQHDVDGRGDLTSIDVETGRASTLAAEFASVALVERGTGTDVVAPGARVAYQFRARFDSPYDGIWVATLP
jgi:hypothetical protein